MDIARTIRGGLPFQGKDRTEYFHLFFLEHWIQLLKMLTKVLIWTLLIISITIVFLIVNKLSIGKGVLLSLLGMFLFSQFTFLTMFYKYFLSITIVTNNKIHCIRKSLFIRNRHETININSLQNISRNQNGMVQNTLGYGDIILEAQNSIITLKYVPRIRKVYDAISKLRENEQRQSDKNVPAPSITENI